MQPVSPGESARSISLILPAWNESEVITTAIEEADAALSGIVSEYEIIVVDDGSTDGTANIVGEIAKSNPNVRLICHSPNKGYGAALRTGFSSAEKDLVVFTDADCQFDLNEIDRFLLLSRDYDIVCGYRIDRKDTPLRCLYSKVYNQMVRILLKTGVRDVDCAMKMFHREVIQSVDISGNGFLVNSEILTQAKQQGRSVVEVGVSHRPRTQGTSTVSISHIPKVLKSLARYWWNVAQFPSDAESVAKDGPYAPSPKSDRRFGYLQWGLLLIASIFLFLNSGYPLLDRDETRYAEIAREMFISGNWVLPQLNFETYYDKPPLVYWLCALSYSIFGVGESAARLVPALAALATIGSTMFFTSRIFNKRVGLLSGVVLMLSIGFVFTSRYLLLDGVLTLLVSLSLFTAYEAIRDKKLKLGWWIASGAFCGLATLTKGPLALVLWFPPVFLFSWLTSRCARPSLGQFALIGLVATAVTAPWCIAVSIQDPQFLKEFFYTHNVARFAGEFHNRPVWFFIPVLLIAGHPWSFLTIPYGQFLFGQSENLRLRRPPAIGFAVLWSLWCLLFFSVAKCKLPTYLLPAAPALALMIGHYLDQVLHDVAHRSQHWFARFWSARTATATTCFAGVAFVGYTLISGNEVSLSVFAWGLLWISLFVSSTVLIRDRHQAKSAWATSTVVAFLLAVMVMHDLVPAYSRSQSLFQGDSSFGPQIAADSKPPIATVSHEFSEVPFYLDRDDIPNFAHHAATGLKEFVAEHDSCILIVKKGISTQELREQLPPDISMKPIGVRGPAQLIEIQAGPAVRMAKGNDSLR